MLVFGVGGGGDIAGAAAVAYMLEELGVERAYIGAVVWERYVIDPVPGPIPFDDIRNGELIFPSVMMLDGDEYAIRRGRRVVFQAAKVAKITGRKVYAFNINEGARGVSQGIDQIIKYLGIDMVVGVDVGGDALAEGCEGELWSPLADFVSIAGILRSSAKHKLLAVLGLGADGELSAEYLIRRIALLMARGALVGIFGLSEQGLRILKLLMSKGVISETGVIVLEAAKGVMEERLIRGGSRRVLINPIMIITWIVDLVKAHTELPLAQALIRSNSILEARNILNGMRIATELDLEEELYKLVIKGVRPRGQELLKIWDNLRRRLREQETL